MAMVEKSVATHQQKTAWLCFTGIKGQLTAKTPLAVISTTGDGAG
jgi:hypothetical protein